MRSTTRILVILISASAGIISISGCIQQAPQDQQHENLINADPGTQFHLRINQIAFLRSDDLKIKFLNVTEDSRCPSDAVCIWRGQATIVVNILKNDKNIGEFGLTSSEGREDLAVKNFDGYSIKLIKVDPYPTTAQETVPSDYIATLVVTKI